MSSSGEKYAKLLPMVKSALEKESDLEPQIRSWGGGSSIEILSPKDWFLQGRDLDGGYRDSLNFWHHNTRSGLFVWAPPPATADACLEEL